MLIGGLFVDGANLVASLRSKGKVPGVQRRIDYSAFPRVLARGLSQDGKTIDFRYKRYYGAYRDARDMRSRQTFRKVLENAGWILHDFQAKAYRIEDGKCPVCQQPWNLPGETIFRDKGVDIALALDAFNAVADLKVNVLAVVTHDSDFTTLFNRTQGAGVRRVVVGWKSEMPLELREAAEPFYLDDVMEDIEYKP